MTFGERSHRVHLSIAYSMIGSISVGWNTLMLMFDDLSKNKMVVID
jgi:hypothetical protein